MTRTDDMMAALQHHLRGTAFAFRRTPNGFDIELDLANPAWWVILRETRLTTTSSFTITTDEIDSKYTIVETLRRIEWGADGAPRFAAPAAVTTRQELNSEVDLRVSAEPIRRLIRLEADNLSFNETLDRKKLFTMLGVAAAGVVAVGAIVMVLVTTMQG